MDVGQTAARVELLEELGVVDLLVGRGVRLDRDVRVQLVVLLEELRLLVPELSEVGEGQGDVPVRVLGRIRAGIAAAGQQQGGGREARGSQHGGSAASTCDSAGDAHSTTPCSRWDWRSICSAYALVTAGASGTEMTWAVPSPYERKTSFDMGALPCAVAGTLLPQGGGCQELKTLPLPECVLQVTRTCPAEGLRQSARPACALDSGWNHRRSGGVGPQKTPLNTRTAGVRCRFPRRVRDGVRLIGDPGDARRKMNGVRPCEGAQEGHGPFPRSFPELHRRAGPFGSSGHRAAADEGARAPAGVWGEW